MEQRKMEGFVRVFSIISNALLIF